MDIKSDDKQAKSSVTYYEHKESESIESKTLEDLDWQMGLKAIYLATLKEVTESGKPAQTGDPEPPEYLYDKYEVSSWQIEGKKVFSFAPIQNKTNKQVFFLHGGAYIYSFFDFHWNLIDVLINEFGCTVTAPDYPLAPNYTYFDAFKFVEPIYKKIVSEHDPKDVILLGDSAGGGFTLGLAQKLKQENIPQPSHIILFSPWLDIGSTNPEIPELIKVDPISTLEGMQMAAKSYTRGGDIKSYMVAPMYGPLEGLAKISLFISTHDVLYADAQKFKSICDQKGVALDYYLYPNMKHDWALLDMPEAKSAMQQIRPCFI